MVGIRNKKGYGVHWLFFTALENLKEKDQMSGRMAE